MIRVGGAQTAQTRNIRATIRALRRDIRNIDDDVFHTRAKLDEVTAKLDVVIVQVTHQADVTRFGVPLIIIMLWSLGLMIYVMSDMIRRK